MTEVEIPFNQLLTIVDRLPPKERIILRKSLDKSWEERFEATLAKLREKTKGFTPEEVEANVAEAVREVRREKHASSSIGH